MSQTGSEKKPFLGAMRDDQSPLEILIESSSASKSFYRDHKVSCKKSCFNRSSFWIFCHSILLLIYTLIFIIVLSQQGLDCQTNLHPDNPALPDVSIKHKVSYYNDFEESIFAGPPSPEVDGAWHSLLQNMALRVTDEELLYSNQSSVALPEGGGNMAWLGVFHELHCIKMLRQWNYRGHYHSNLTEEDRPHWDIHADHCLDLLRSAAMCRADTTLTTFGWAAQERPMLNTRLIPRRCVDWNTLMESVAHRTVEEDEIGALVNPLRSS